MEWVTTLFLENPAPLLIGLGVIEVILAAVWFTRRPRGWQYVLTGPVVLAVGVALLAHFVQTDREQIRSASQDIVSDLRVGRLDALDRHLDDRFWGWFQGTRIDKETALARAREGIDPDSGVDVRIVSQEIDVEGDRAVQRVRTLIYFNDGRRAPLRWTFVWRKENGQWKIRKIEDFQFGKS